MRIAIKGRNTPVTDDIRDYVERRFGKIERQVSPLAELEVEVMEERNPAIADSQVAEVTLHLKGVTLRARDAGRRAGRGHLARLIDPTPVATLAACPFWIARCASARPSGTRRTRRSSPG